MTDPTTKQEVLDLIIEGRQAFDAVLGKLSDAARTERVLEGGWALKDVLHHISAWERLMVHWVEQSFRGETPDRPAPDEEWDDLDGRNEVIFAEGRTLNEDEVLAEFLDSYHAALDVVKAMSDDDLFNGDRFAWRRGYPIWHLIAGNTWLHYDEHRRAIETWLDQPA